jgi:hypothetical protein
MFMSNNAMYTGSQPSWIEGISHSVNNARYEMMNPIRARTILNDMDTESTTSVNSRAIWEEHVRGIEQDRQQNQQRHENRYERYRRPPNEDLATSVARYWSKEHEPKVEIYDDIDTSLTKLGCVVFIENSMENCAVCDEKCTAKTSCMHAFCKECLHRWLIVEQKDCCPYCRQSLK